VILIAGGTLVLGLIGTFAYFKFSGHKEEASAEAAPHGKEETSKEHGNVGVPGAMFDLDPFIVNLSDVPESRYLKLTVKLELDRPDIAAELSARIPQVRDTILILTTNGERELPQAFLRRCVALTLDAPTEDWFVSIANQKFGADADSLHREVAREVMRHRAAAKKARFRQPSTSEYLDALDVCRDLGIDTSSSVWTDVARSVLWKNDRPPELETVASQS